MTTKEAIAYEQRAIRRAKIRAINALASSSTSSNEEYRQAMAEAKKRENLVTLMQDLNSSLRSPTYLRAYTPESLHQNNYRFNVGGMENEI